MKTHTGPSDWPLPPDGVRFLVPKFLRRQLAEHALSRELYPVAMGYYPEARGHEVERTEHLDNLLLYCSNGQGILEVDGASHRVGKGDLIMLPAGHTHSYRADSVHPWSLYWVHFVGEQSAAIWELLDYAPERPVLTVGLLQKFVTDFELLLEVRRTGYHPPAFVYAANQLRQMLTYLASAALTRPATGTGLDLAEIHALMEEHLHGQLDLDALAKHAALSKYTFARKYKQLTGRPPIQHFIHLKMERACYLLDVTGKRVSQVANMLGYDDVYYFSRLFRKVVGVSPSQYRALRHG